MGANKILIFGMHRSGTTLLADLVAKHPQIEHVFNESVLLNLGRDELLAANVLIDHEIIQNRGVLRRASNLRRKDIDVNFDLQKSNWAAKMSYPGPVILQEWQRSTKEYAERWLEYFGDDARIIHLTRHPFDIYLSAHARWANHQRHIDNYGEVTLDNICRDWSHALDVLLPAFDDDDRVQLLRYETLLAQPEATLASLFKNSGLGCDTKLVSKLLNTDLIFFGKLRADRAFRYRREKTAPSYSRSTKHLLAQHFANFEYDYEFAR